MDIRFLRVTYLKTSNILNLQKDMEFFILEKYKFLRTKYLVVAEMLKRLLFLLLSVPV
jgi:hypothetical protein